MAVNEPLWQDGGPVLIDSTGSTVDPDWAYGGPFLLHEYVAVVSALRAKWLTKFFLLKRRWL